MSETLIVIFTGVVAITTLVYMLITGWLALETRKMRQAQTEPRVSVRVEEDQSGFPGFELVIKNEGNGPAKEVRFEFTGDPSYFHNSVLGKSPPTVDQLPAIKEGLDLIEAGYTLRFALGNVDPEEFERAILNPWRFYVSYKSLSGKETKKLPYIIDFSQFEGQFFAKNWMQEISNSLANIQKDLHRLTEGHARVRVITQTKKEFERQREAWLKERGTQLSSFTEMADSNSADEQ